jgi:hypothetical protein
MINYLSGKATLASEGQELRQAWVAATDEFIAAQKL